MSDSMRKDFSSKAEEKMTPDSQKSTLDQAKESATSASDSVAKNVQPGEDKSFTQQASDTLGGSKPGEKPLMEQAQDFAKGTYDQAAKVVTDTYNSVAGEGGSK